MTLEQALEWRVIERCVVCGRRAGWFWPGYNYFQPRFLCGYHKRAYVHVWRLLK